MPDEKIPEKNELLPPSTYTVRINPELREWLAQRKEETGQSIHWLVNCAVSEYIKRRKSGITEGPAVIISKSPEGPAGW